MNKLLEKLNRISKKQALLIIALATFVVYANHLPNGFVWDDEEQIVNNAVVHSLSNISHIFSGATFNTGGAGLSGWFFRPLITLWFMLNYVLWGGASFGFHFTQLLLHILNSCLLFLLLEKLNSNNKNKLSRAVNLILSLFFAVHSGINEAVVYISAVSELAFTTTSLLALNILLGKYKNKYVAIGTIIFSGFLFKESALTIIPILIIFAYIYRKKSFKQISLLSLFLAFFYFFIRLVVAKTPIRHPAFSPISEATFWQRILTIPREFMDYLRLSFFPSRLGVSQHYVITSFRDSLIYLVPLLVIFSLLLYFLLKSRSKLGIFGTLWFLLGFSLISNIFPLDMTIAERWLYFPMIGIIFVLAELLNKYRFLVFIVFISLLPLSVRTIVRNSNWRDGLSLYTHDISSSTDSFDLENNLGVELVRAGDLDNAKSHLLRSIELQPQWHFAYNNVGVVYQRQGDIESSRYYYLETLKHSDYFRAYENLISLEYSQGNLNKAEEYALLAVSKLPFNTSIRLYLVIIQKDLGKLGESLDNAKILYKLSPSPQTKSLLDELHQELLDKQVK